jgi:hypothetical protein
VSLTYTDGRIYYSYAFIFSQLHFGQKGKRDAYISALQLSRANDTVTMLTAEGETARVHRPFRFDVPYIQVQVAIPPGLVLQAVVSGENISLPVCETTYRVYESGLGIQTIAVKQDQTDEESILKALFVGTPVFAYFRDGVDKLRKDLSTVEPQEVEWTDRNLVDDGPGIIWQKPCILIWLAGDPGPAPAVFGDEIRTDETAKVLTRILCRAEPQYEVNYRFLASYDLKEPDSKALCDLSYYADYYIAYFYGALLVIHNKRATAQIVGRTIADFTAESVVPRSLEVMALLKAKCYALAAGNVALDAQIQKIDGIYRDTAKTLGDSRHPSDEDTRAVLTAIKGFLDEWIRRKTHILRILEDPSIERSGMATYHKLYNVVSEELFVGDMASVLETKLRHLDRVYDDILDLVRLHQLGDMVG